MATLLSIVQEAAVELGLSEPATVATSDDPQTKQLFYLCNATGKQLQRDHAWTVLQKEWNISTAAPLVTTGDITEDSAVVTNIPDTSSLTAPYFICTGDSIPVAARIASVDSATQVTLTMRATATETGASLTFAQDTYDEPDDFDRFINRTHWDRTNRWELLGPTSPQFWQWYNSGVVTVGPRRHYRQIGVPNQNFRLWPPPSVLDSPFQIVFEYVSKNWAVSSSGTPKASFTADDDEPYIDERAFVLGTKWRYLQVKQFDYAPAQLEYNDWVSNLIGIDGGAPTLSLNTRDQSFFITPGNVQDGFWPGPTGPNMG